MSWTEIIRFDYDRRGLCYVSDVTDGEWGTVIYGRPPDCKCF